MDNQNLQEPLPILPVGTATTSMPKKLKILFILNYFLIFIVSIIFVYVSFIFFIVFSTNLSIFFLILTIPLFALFLLIISSIAAKMRMRIPIMIFTALLTIGFAFPLSLVYGIPSFIIFTKLDVKRYFSNHKENKFMYFFIGTILIYFLVFVILLSFFIIKAKSNSKSYNATASQITTAPTPSSDPTTNWKTYQGKDFSVKYPPLWASDNFHVYDPASVYKDGNGGNTTLYKIQLWFNEVTTAQSLDDYVKQYYGNLNGVISNKIVVSGINALSFFNPIGAGTTGWYVAFSNNKDMVLFGPNVTEIPKDTQFNQILTTFKFTDSPTPSSTPRTPHGAAMMNPAADQDRGLYGKARCS